MQRSPSHRWLLGAVAITIGWALPVAATQPTVSETYGKLPLSFEVNVGQVDREVKFLSRGQGYALFLTPKEAVLSLGSSPQETAVVRWHLAGGNAHPRMAGERPLSTRSNYFLGSDRRQWHTDVPSYAAVRYEGVYPGVDLVYRGNQRQLEYDFVIAPRADPGRIRLAFRGAYPMAIGTRGELILRTANGRLVQRAPVVFQDAGERRERVEGRYVLLAAPSGLGVAAGVGASRQVGFAVSRYDRARPLIIDPIVAYSTFLGGGGADVGNSIAVDSVGNAYITGITYWPSDFPGAKGSPIQPVRGGGNADAFVTKINAAGTAIVYSTYLGGDGLDQAASIAVDAAGNAYVTGLTDSINFPGASQSPIQPQNASGSAYGVDAFVTKINATGTAIVYSTFLGGTGNDFGNGIAVDGAGNAYVTGQSGSTTFPGVSGSSIQPTNRGSGGNAFVTKINATGTAIVYSTFLGGMGSDGGNGIAVDGAGNAYVTGRSTSTTFPGVSGSSIQPTNGGGADAFVTKIDATGTAILYSTYLGGGGDDSGASIAVDGAGNAYVTGATRSATFPGVGAGSIQPTNGGYGCAFVTKIDATGAAIVYSTFLGYGAEGQGIAVDGAGNAFVTGDTGSTVFPGITGGSIQPVYGGSDSDGFLTKVNAAGTAIIYSTFLGGNSVDFGLGVAVDNVGNVYVTGSTVSATFPGVSASSLQPANAGGGDAFVIKIGQSPPVAGAQSLTVSENGSLPITLTAMDQDGNALTYAIVEGPAHGALSGTAPTVTYTPAANYFGPDSFTFNANDGRIDSNTAVISLWVDAPPVATAQSLVVVENGSLPITLTAMDPDGDALTYVILAEPVHGTLSGTAPAVTYMPAAGYFGPDNFTFKANDGRSDSNLAAVTITVKPAGLLFYTLPPCRLFDSRSSTGPLPSDTEKDIQAGGLCGVPGTAVAIAVNVTVVKPTGAGFLQLYLAAGSPPATSVANFSAGQVRANNAVVELSQDATFAARFSISAAGRADLIVDVSGYFE